MIRRPPGSTRTDTVVPDTTLFRSHRRLKAVVAGAAGAGHVRQRMESVTPLADQTGNSGGVGTVGGCCKPVSFCLPNRSEEHTSELQSLMRISFAVLCLKKKTITPTHSSYLSSLLPLFFTYLY